MDTYLPSSSPSPANRYGLGQDYVYGLLPIAEQLFHVDLEQNISTLFCMLACWGLTCWGQQLS